MWSCRHDVFCVKCNPKNFKKFTGKHLCKIITLINCTAYSLQPVTLLNMRFWLRRFSLKLVNGLSTVILKNIYERLLLNIIILWILIPGKNTFSTDRWGTYDFSLEGWNKLLTYLRNITTFQVPTLMGSGPLWSTSVEILTFLRHNSWLWEKNVP